MTPLVWLHGDCLNPNNPASAAYPTAPAVFVFDTALLRETGTSLKRIVFLYESALAIPAVSIRKGDVATEVAAAARDAGCDAVVTVMSVAPRFRQIVRALRETHRLPVTVLPAPAFVDLPEGIDLKRFSRYWQRAQALAMRPSGPPPSD